MLLINLELELKQKIAKNDAKSIKLDELILSLKDEKERQNEAFQGLLNKLEREYYFAINEAKKAAKLQDVKDAQRAINKANDLIKAINKPQTQAPQPLNPGDSVKYGKIISLKQKRSHNRRKRHKNARATKCAHKRRH